MGSKKLKAIVFHGNKSSSLADEDLLDEYYQLRGWDKEGNPKKIPEFLGAG